MYDYSNPADNPDLGNPDARETSSDYCDDDGGCGDNVGTELLFDGTSDGDAYTKCASCWAQDFQAGGDVVLPGFEYTTACRFERVADELIEVAA